MKHFLLSIFLFLSMVLFAQEQQPWTGGVNVCQFGRMDLDGDGIKDLLVFDRHDSRLLCYLNQGGAGEIEYHYTSVYDAFFPELSGWVVFADYDGDGREDLFTFSKGWPGIKVYRNVSVPDRIMFELVVFPYLTSYQGGGEVNILATDADYPAIVDLDDDGDLDILTFGVMGTFIEKHLNLSVERYGHRDSLVFERTEQCWGRVAESDEDNRMYLDTCLFGRGIRVDRDGFRHRGATVAVRDLNGDGLLDLLLADVDYPGLTLLVNGGDADKALMVSQTEDFPPHDPVHLFSMPVPFFTDIDNDGDDDLLVSPFAPDPMACEGHASIWLYLNHGTDQAPDFHLYTKSFLQEEMVDVGTGSYPVVVDWDGDGLLDLVVGTVGDIDSIWYQYGSLKTRRSARLTWLRNVGTATQPVFNVEPPFLQGKMGMVPAFADLDGDGRMECLVGTAEGNLMLFGHDGKLLDGDFLHYDHPWSAPCFYDVDRDGVMDLVVGNATGKLSFYKRKMEYGLVSDEWGGVDVRDYATSYYGYSVPTLFQCGGETLLAVGSESGKVFLFDGVSAEEDVVFHEASDRWKELGVDMPERLGMRSSVAVADLDGDGLMEVVVGSFAGGLRLFNADIPIHNFGISESHEDDRVAMFPNPVQSQLHIVSKADDIQWLIVLDVYGRKVGEMPIQAKDAVVDVSGLRPGVYCLTLLLERGAVNRIFLKR